MRPIIVFTLLLMKKNQEFNIRTSKHFSRNRVFATNSDFLIPLNFYTDGENLLHL